MQKLTSLNINYLNLFGFSAVIKLAMLLVIVGLISACDNAVDAVTGSKNTGPCTGTGLSYKCQGRTCTLLPSGTAVRCDDGQVCQRANSQTLPFCSSS